MKPVKAVEDRLRRRIVIDENGCWLWQGCLDRNGYGQLGITVAVGRKKIMRAHQVAWMTFVGPLPEKPFVLDHRCSVPRCINPSHLRIVTQRENVMSGKTIPANNAAKTACTHGHAFTPENTTMVQGARRCLTCQKERPWEHRELKKRKGSK